MLGAYFHDDDFNWLRCAEEWEQGTRSLAYGDAGVTPLHNLWYHAIYHCFGRNPCAFYLSTLLLHGVLTLLVALLLWRVTRSRLATLGGALAFAVLFTHQEAIAWTQSVHHVVAGFFYLGSILLWLHYRDGHRLALPAAVLFATGATLSKESAMGLLPVLLALDWLLYPRQSHRPLAWFLLAYAAHGLWRLWLPPLQDSVPFGSDEYHLSPLRMLTNLLLVPPQILVPDFRFENYAAFLQRLLPAAAVGIVLKLAVPLLVVTTLAALLAYRQGSRLVRLAIAWCYLAYLPFLPFVYSLARAPRYGYIASVGACLLLGLIVQEAGRGPKPRWAPLIAVGLYLAASVGLLQLMAASRLRDSRVRVAVLAAVHECVPHPRAGQVIHLTGLARQFHDLECGGALGYGPSVCCCVGGEHPVGEGYCLQFDPRSPGRLQKWRRGEPWQEGLSTPPPK